VGVEIQLFEFGSYEEVPLAKRMCMAFQHDGVPAHYSCLVTHHLNQTFPKQSIGRGGHVQWTPRSPDLTPLDFCLWGWMKSEVYKEKVNTTDQSVARTMNSAALLKQEHQDDLSRATRTVVKKVEKCIEVDGGIFEHLL
jgi:hypothetical protein